MKRDHFLTLDSFRGLCACIVALSHFNGNSIFLKSTLFDRGDIYVDFFFVLSGFVIFANYRDRLQSGYSITKFIFLRFGRLWPLHFVVLMAFIGIDLLQYVIHIDGAALYAPFSAPGEGLKEIFANIFLVHSLHTIDTLAFNGPSWSISTEFYTYILFAVLLCYTGRFYRIAIFVLATISVAGLFFFHGELYSKLDYGFLRCVYGFGCGALTYEAYRFYEERINRKLQRRILPDILETALTAGVIIYIGWFSYGTSSLAAPPLFSILILLFAFEAGFISRVLKLKPLIFIGTLSYSIYMIHLFISGKFFALPIRLLENRLGWQISFQQNGITYFGIDKASGTMLEIFYLATVIGCSWISYKLIENPCRLLSRKIVNGGWPQHRQQTQISEISTQ